MEEIWKDILGYEGLYKISLTGKIKSLERLSYNGKGMMLRKEKIIKQFMNQGGYFSVSMYKNGKQKSHLVHRLLANVFIANPEKLKEINHKNGVKTDNRIENLEWCTRQHNIQHAFDNKLNFGARGESHWSRILTENKVIELRKKYATGKYTQPQLGKIYGVDSATINNIIHRRKWKHI